MNRVEREAQEAHDFAVGKRAAAMISERMKARWHTRTVNLTLSGQPVTECLCPGCWAKSRGCRTVADEREFSITDKPEEKCFLCGLFPKEG